MVYYAKSWLQNGTQPTCCEHIKSVAALAEKYGAVFHHGRAAHLAGQLHDFGKYSERFQGVLRGTHTGVDHAFCGAAALIQMAGRNVLPYTPVVEAINGHHDGLLDFNSINAYCRQSFTDALPIRCNAGKEASLAGNEEYSAAVKAFADDFPDFRLTSTLRKSISLHRDNRLRDMLLTRMIFSCLVDADYSVSAEEERPGYIEATEDCNFETMTLLKRLTAYQNELKSSSAADCKLNGLRDELFTRCGEAGRLPEGLFTLTAPTGTAKTLALLNFALQHCMTHGKRRIIIVLPFLTLAEQNTTVYSKIVDNILVDHSQSKLDQAAREFAQRWTSPFIITTSVKFFETLFAQKPTDCRKLHSISGSVVIFDEAQSLPPELTATTLEAVNALCSEYHCSMLFSTATQPNFASLSGVDWRPTEINTNCRNMYSALRRTEVQWRLNERIPLETIAAEMAVESCVCTIVNRRDHARKLYNLLKNMSDKREAFFLTNDLSPSHRSRIVETIKERLKGGEPCRVVATQCIEAGVDLDFAVMYRALAPLEAIIQAAGRCNRNRTLDKMGQVIVFEPDEKKQYPSKWYENTAILVKVLLSRQPIDIHDPQDIKLYYEELFRSSADSKPLTDAIERKDYIKTADEYCLIKNQGVRVLVPVPGSESLYKRLREEALATGITSKWMMEAAPITVSTFDTDALALHGENLKYAARKIKGIVPSDYYVLLPGHTDCYTDDMGLQFRETSSEDYCF